MTEFLFYAVVSQPLDNQQLTKRQKTLKQPKPGNQNSAPQPFNFPVSGQNTRTSCLLPVNLPRPPQSADIREDIPGTRCVWFMFRTCEESLQPPVSLVRSLSSEKLFLNNCESRKIIYRNVLSINDVTFLSKLWRSRVSSLMDGLEPQIRLSACDMEP